MTFEKTVSLIVAIVIMFTGWVGLTTISNSTAIAGQRSDITHLHDTLNEIKNDVKYIRRHIK